MAFDFDTFINEVCIGTSNHNGVVKAGIFGKMAYYIPLSSKVKPFVIIGDFHKDYQAARLETMDETLITSEKIRLCVREVVFPKYYPKAQQGDVIAIDSLRFEIVDIRQHIPRSQMLFLHEVI